MGRSFFLFLLLTACSMALAAPTTAPTAKPNILLILADDLGYSDLGCYGGEISTPNLDRLAKNGLRFTQFYNGARCCPSRASLLTGQYPHAVGFPLMKGSLPKNCITIPELLHTAGYRTYMSGKWHLGNPNPVQRGFDEYFGMLGGFGSYWNPDLFTRLPKGSAGHEYKKGEFYATDAITDNALDFVADGRKSGKPWFLYLAYTAPHFPLHAPKDLIAKYLPTYEKGWDKIREERYARMKQLGLVDANWPLTPRSNVPPNQFPAGWNNKVNPAWDSLDADRRADLAHRMAIYAAMVDRMDQGIGRVIESLEKSGDLDNTLIFFLSDNGACAEWNPLGFDKNSGPTNILHKGAELDTMGSPGTYHSYGSGWANACNTPFRLYKHYDHEGGISTPLIIHWPAGMKRLNQIDTRVGDIIDFLPTCAEVAGATYPKDMNGTAILPMEGRSLTAAMKNEPDAPRAIYFEHEGNKAVREGKWKLVALKGEPWELYDIEADRVELKNLAADNSKLVEELSAKWQAWHKRVTANQKETKGAGEE